MFLSLKAKLVATCGVVLVVSMILSGFNYEKHQVSNALKTIDKLNQAIGIRDQAIRLSAIAMRQSNYKISPLMGLMRHRRLITDR